MQASTITGKDEIIVSIKNRISDILGGETGGAVNLENFLYHESDAGGRVRISCLFINEDGRVCADMYRTGTAGSIDFICGRVIDSINEKTLKKILAALEESRWSASVEPSSGKKKKSILASALKLPFFQKGA